MKQLRLITICAAVLLLSIGSRSALADYRELTVKGNKALQQDDVETALEHYREADVELPGSPKISYNIGTALYKKADYESAADRLSKALNTDEAGLQADAYYNLGNSFFRAEKYPEAIEAYKKTLELNPEDTDAKYNLELARKKLKDQAQQQQQDEQQQQQQDQEQQDQQQQDQQQQDQQQQDQKQDQQQDQQQDKQQQGDQESQQDQQQQQQQDSQQGDQEQQGQQGQEGEQEQDQQQQQGQVQQQGMSKEDAERLLRALGRQEKELQKKVQRRTFSPVPYEGKDW